MSQNYISVVMPAYNAQTYIEQAIESVLLQTCTDFELIVVDDASTDKTYDIVHKYELKDSRVRCYKNETNSGVAYSRNFGVQQAKYDWIAFIDSDDCWREDKLQKQVEVANKDIADIIYTGYGFMDSEGTMSKNVFRVPTRTVYKELLKQNVMSCSGIMLRKELLKTHTMKHDAVHEDFYTWLTMLRDGAVAIGIDEPLHTVRTAMKESKSGNKFKSAIMTYKTYRLLGLPWYRSLYYFAFYMYRNIKKYSKI